MTTFKVSGQRDEQLVGSIPGVARFFADTDVRISVRDAVRVDVSRAATAKPLTLEGVKDSDVVLLELDSGVRLFLRADRVPTELGAQAQRGKGGELVLPTSISLGDRQRGIGSFGLRLLKVIGIDAASLALKPLVWAIERQLEPGPGLYRWTGAEELDLRPVVADDIPTDQPVLVMIHGTASRSMGSFGALGEGPAPATWDRLHKRFGEHIYGFEHHTLSQSPIENARDLLANLPSGMQHLHLLSHSRGGLVGELVCRGQVRGRPPFDRDIDLRLFHGAEYADHRDALAELGELLLDRRPRVPRFVRVGCPARGTTLASGRLDHWFSNLATLVGTVTGLGEHPLYDFLTSLTTAVVHKKADPEELPGLAAQMPGSPLVRMLNRADVEIDADLTVLAGDIEGGGALSKIGVFVADRFFPGPNDLVVDTDAMFGGTQRQTDPLGFLDRGPDVNHLAYFRNTNTVRRLVQRLTVDKGSDAQFEAFAQRPDPIPRGRAGAPAGQRGAVTGPRPVVYLLPGIMGSHLSVNGSRVWLNPARIAIGRFSRLEIDADGVEADSVMGSTYGDLREFLRESHDVETFPFDWRRPIEEAADLLAQSLRATLASTGTLPVRLLAHSMGGLVARTMIAKYPDLWQDIVDRDGRLVMLGTPNRGSYTVPAVLLGMEKIVKYLALADLRNDREEILEIVARFTGLLGMLPWDDDGRMFRQSTWARLRAAMDGEITAPTAADLRAARAQRDLLKKPVKHHERMVYVAGQAKFTPAAIAIRNGKPRIRASRRGDGRVLWDSGVLDGVQTYFAEDVSHGKLPDVEDLFEPIRELLESGRTRRLPRELPAGVRGEEELVDMPEFDPRAFPTAADMEAAAMGFEGVVRAKPRPRVHVKVVHGDLGFAAHPVVVGHYEGDAIVSAEAFLDRHLDGRLSERRNLGTYPGPIESAVVVRNPRENHLAAVVIGLGRVGELSPGHLAKTFANGCLRYAKAVDECPLRPADGTRRTASLSVLLIGSGEGGFGVERAIRSLLDGMTLAIRALESAELEQRVSFGELEFIELYDDRSVQAATALLQCGQERRYQDHFTFGDVVEPGSGGRRQVTYNEDSAWWTRLQIRRRSRESDALDFVPLTETARAEIVPLDTQRKLLDRFVELAVRGNGWNNQHAITLFELLVPNAMKRSAQGQRDLVLVLDDDTAQFPWELLQAPERGGEEPISVRAGMVRQLMTHVYREQVVTPIADTALVIGDPPSEFIELPGARREAEWVAGQLLVGGFAAESCIQSDVTTILNSLFERPLKVLHVAAHGTIDHGQNEDGKNEGGTGGLAGIVIGEDTILTPGDIEQMSQVPELVFLNCCYLGRHLQNEQPAPNRTPHKLAANLGTHLINMGVRAVVAAGWEVDDAAAMTFAQEFYAALLAGRTFGDAVKRARSQTFVAHGARANTWGAYQCYGDPAYRLVSAERSSGGVWRPQFVSAIQTAAAASNLAAMAKTASGARREQMLAEAEWIHDQVQAHWPEDGASHAALARAYGELKQFGTAVDLYDIALRCEDGAAGLRAAEQRANLRVRDGERLANLPRRRGVGVRRIKDGIRELNLLLDIGETAERRSMVGSAYKRLLQASGSARRGNRMLEQMTEAYREAARIATQDVAYPLANALTGELLLAIRADEEPAPEFIGSVDGLQAVLAERPRNFWNDVGVIEAEVLACMASDDLGAARGTALRDLDAKFKSVTRDHSSPREFDSVLKQFDFMLLMVEDQRQAEGWGPVIEELQVLRERVRAIRF